MKYMKPRRFRLLILVISMVATDNIFCNELRIGTIVSAGTIEGLYLEKEKYSVSRNYIADVEQKYFTETEKLLKNERIVEITAEKANLLAGYKVWLKENSRLYLIRISRYQYTDSVSAYSDGENLLVSILSTRGSVGKLIYAPVIVSLPSKPIKLYITIGALGW